MAIRRFLSEKNLERLMKERGFLIKNIINSEGELQLCLRDNYFNVYYRGNSLAKVIFEPENKYKVEINSKFVPQVIIDDPEFSNNYRIATDEDKETSYIFNIEQDKLKKLLRKDYIEAMKLKIAKVDYKQELEFQHSIMVDNILNEKYLLIDIQITDKYFNRKRVDLIALKNIGENKYRIVVIEVKLGNNGELKEAVYTQLKRYTEHVNKYFDCYKETYEKQYYQLKQLGLLYSHKYETITIDNQVEELILVGRYIVKAKEQIAELIANHPDIKDKVKLLTYRL